MWAVFSCRGTSQCVLADTAHVDDILGGLWSGQGAPSPRAMSTARLMEILMTEMRGKTGAAKPCRRMVRGALCRLSLARGPR